MSYVTRLHVRYDKAHFPEDLVFQETGDRTNFQGRYVLRQAWSGEDSCGAAREYRITLRQRQEAEAERLASLTGWALPEIRKRMALGQRGAGASGDVVGTVVEQLNGT